MTDPQNAEKAREWTGCVHCGQTLPHEGTGWRESSRCRLFQRIAEQAWAEGYRTGTDFGLGGNPYLLIPPGKEPSDG